MTKLEDEYKDWSRLIKKAAKEGFDQAVEELDLPDPENDPIGYFNAVVNVGLMSKLFEEEDDEG